MLHKTRGGKGKWSTIDTMELIRVTKGIGKRLRLDVSSTNLPAHDFAWDNLSIRLFDLQGDSTITEKEITMDTRSIAKEDNGDGEIATISQVELKVYDLCKNLQFHVTYECPLTGKIYHGKSIQFSTHDSGKQRKKSPSVNVDIKEVPKKVTKKEKVKTAPPVIEPIKESPTYSGYSSPSRSTSCEEPSDESFGEITTHSEDSNPFISDHFEVLPPEIYMDNGYEDILSKKRKVDEMLTIQEGFSHYYDGSIDVNGIVRAQNFLQYSDVRFKTNIEDITDALNIISHLQGKTYQWKSNESELTGGRRVLGLIAQEVRRIIPEAVHEDNDGYLSVNYTDIVPLLIEALKQHVKNYQSDHVVIKEEINQLRDKINAMSLASKESDTWSIYKDRKSVV